MKAAKTIIMFIVDFFFFSLTSLFNVYYFHQSTHAGHWFHGPVPLEMVKFNPELSQNLNKVFLSKDM